MTDILILLLCFVVFAIVQALFINGVHECFRGKKIVDEAGKVEYEGMIFYMMAPKFFEKHRHKQWSRPLWGCVKCQSSVWGALTYWPTVIYLFEFQWEQIFIFIIDVFMLVYLNAFFYKQL